MLNCTGCLCSLLEHRGQSFEIQLNGWLLTSLESWASVLSLLDLSSLLSCQCIYSSVSKTLEFLLATATVAFSLDCRFHPGCLCALLPFPFYIYSLSLSLFFGSSLSPHFFQSLHLCEDALPFHTLVGSKSISFFLHFDLIRALNAFFRCIALLYPGLFCWVYCQANMGSFCTAKLFVSSGLEILLYNVGVGIMILLLLPCITIL